MADILAGGYGRVGRVGMSAHIEPWLRRALRGVPADMRDDVRAELLAHYEDAVADYVAQGMALPAAQQQALADLGDAALVGQALHDTFHAESQYKRAVVLGVVLPLCLPFLVLTMQWHMWIDGVVLVCWLLPLWLALAAFRVLLGQQVGVNVGLRPFRLMRAGSVLLALLLLMSPLILPDNTLFVLLDPTAAIFPWLQHLISGLLLLSLGVIGGGMLSLGDAFWDYRQHCTLLEKTAIWLLLLTGLVLLIVVVVAVVVPQPTLTLVLLAVPIVLIVLLALLHVVLLWLVFQAFYRTAKSPRQAV